MSLLLHKYPDLQDWSAIRTQKIDAGQPALQSVLFRNEVPRIQAIHFSSRTRLQADWLIKLDPPLLAKAAAPNALPVTPKTSPYSQIDAPQKPSPAPGIMNMDIRLNAMLRRDLLPLPTQLRQDLLISLHIEEYQIASQQKLLYFDNIERISNYACIVSNIRGKY
ncbi:hypothetical protein ACQZ6B_15650 [Agrobacterium vitis]